MRKRTGSGPSDWRIQSAILDDALSRQYSEEGHNILGRDIEFYRIFDQHFSRASSPAFSIRGKTPRIFVFGSFFASLDQDERKALIIHELGHYLYRDLTVTYLLALLFTISLGGLIITLALVLLFSGIDQFLTYILISFSAISLTLLTALRWHLAGQEYRADRLVVEFQDENKSIKGVLEKSCSYLRMHLSQNKLRRIEALCLKRLKHLGFTAIEAR
jgi:Zn-dependent protease with chaperone function